MGLKGFLGSTALMGLSRSSNQYWYRLRIFCTRGRKEWSVLLKFYQVIGLELPHCIVVAGRPRVLTARTIAWTRQFNKDC
ncbi:MAG: hypothetical protein OEY86_10230 [Nitrospira sp.]|nr:hypothetical protein [Nitrospira sp.]